MMLHLLLKRQAIAVLFFLCIAVCGFAQEKKTESATSGEQTVTKSENQSKLKVSGYVQAQFQHGEEDASLKVGTANESDKSFNRIGIRRGRIKFTYAEKLLSAVFQLDLTENGIAFKDVYLKVVDPWLQTNSLKAGIFDRPFGYEISYSSSNRETPERSTVFQVLFPEERDMGAMVQLQPSPTSPLHFMKLEAGLFAGNGIKKETDSRKDFIGHLSATGKIGKSISIGGGVSYYNGGVYQATNTVYRMNGNAFVPDVNAANIGEFAKREYLGLDFRLALKSVLGATRLTTEYLWGTQPGAATSHKSPNSSTLPDYDTYIRSFSGGYVQLVQDISKSPFSVVLKYDWYDPNTDVSGNSVGLNNTSKADVNRHTWGAGLLWHAVKNLRLQAYYEFNNNETSTNLAGYDANRKDNVMTVRLQYKF